MSTRFSFQDALLIALVLLAPAYTAGRIAAALAGSVTPATESPVMNVGVPVEEVAPLLEPVAFDAAADFEVVVVVTALPA